ncbi:MAG: DUF4430 domain-containing protein [Clostridia bacterium]|nr:DUF4430 domain-containing protein [Clostridia bacterium]
MLSKFSEFSKSNKHETHGRHVQSRAKWLCFMLSMLLVFLCLYSCAQGASPAADPESDGANENVGETTELSCTLYIECTTILDNMNDFNTDKLEVLPENGIVLEKCTVSFKKGESVYDVMVRELMARKIHMEASYTPVYDSAYVEGINNLYEFDCGAGSGWTYSVNGAFPNYGCSKYYLNDGDAVEWHYTCDFGADVGCIFDADATPTPAP